MFLVIAKESEQERYINIFCFIGFCTAQKLMFSVKDLPSKRDQILRKLHILVTCTEEILDGKHHFFFFFFFLKCCSLFSRLTHLRPVCPFISMFCIILSNSLEVFPEKFYLISRRMSIERTSIWTVRVINEFYICLPVGDL